MKTNKLHIKDKLFGREAMNVSESYDINAGLSIIAAVDSVVTLTERVETKIVGTYTISESYQELNEGVKEIWEKVKEIFKKLYESVKAFFSRVWGKIKMVWSDQIKFVKDNKTKIIEGASYADKDDDVDEVPFLKNAKGLDLTKLLNTSMGKSEIYLIDASSGTRSKILMAKFLNDVENNGIETLSQSVVSNTDFYTRIGDYVGIGKVVKFTYTLKIANKLTMRKDKGASITMKSVKVIAIAAKDIVGPKDVVFDIEVPEYIFDMAELSKALTDAKESIIDEIESVLDDTEDVKLPDIINDAIGWFEKDTVKSRDESDKKFDKLVKNMEKALKKDEGEVAGGKLLNVAYKLFSFIQFKHSKELSVRNAINNNYWSIIKRAYGNYAYVVKQRNVGESTDVTATDDTKYKILNKFGI